MAIETHIKRGHPVVFGLIVFFSIIEGAIATWLTTRFNQHHNFLTFAVRDRTRFLTFVSWWTVFFGLWYMILFLHSASGSVLTSIGSHGLFLFITWVFWTAGAASITAAFGGGYNCSNLAVEIPYCNQRNALEGFAWVNWILVTLALFFVVFRGVSSSRRGDGIRGQLVA